ncbi:MAG TPA: LapA family protein [Candidatus Saccharimonadia bacterium]|nr:LapA family protein [Candidatus Saccharimonadia bacterium]
MKRWLTILVAILVVLAAIVFSATNTTTVALDLYFTTCHLPVGVLVIASLFTGCVLGGLVLYPGVIVPLRMRAANLRRELDRRQAPPAP